MAIFLPIVLAWILLSVPVSLVVGRMLERR